MLGQSYTKAEEVVHNHMTQLDLVFDYPCDIQVTTIFFLHLKKQHGGLRYNDNDEHKNGSNSVFTIGDIII